MRATIILVLCWWLADGWLPLHHEQQRSVQCPLLATTDAPDFQSDSTQYGRGDRHLSAVLQEGDVVAYQTGSWYTSMASWWSHSLVETLQVVWTHNCEHGVIRGWKLEPENGILQQQQQADLIEFGPEQLIARIPVEWTQDCCCRPLVPIGEELWQQHARLFEK